MFNFNRKSEKQSSPNLPVIFDPILSDLARLLAASELNAHADVVGTILKELRTNNVEQFIRLLNGIEMWGGSGAVWEVHIADVEIDRKFKCAMIVLIDQMEEYNIMGQGVKRIRQLLQR